MTPLLLAALLTTHPVMTGEYNGPWLVTVDAEGEHEVLSSDGERVAGPFAASTFTVADVEPWSAETPVWYRLVTTRKDGEREEKIFGFTERVIRGRRFFVNGVPVRVKLGPKDLNGNTASAFACSEDESWTNGVYRLAETNLARVDVEKPLASALATRHAFQDWSITATNYGGRLVVKNRSAFLSAKDVTLNWTLLVDGEEEDSGTIDLLGLKAGETSVFDMPPETQAARFKGGTVSVRFTVERDGEAIATDQIDLVASREPTPVGTEEGFLAFLVPGFLKAKVDFAEEEAGRVRIFTTSTSLLAYDEADPSGGFRYVARGLLWDTPLVDGLAVCRETPALGPNWGLVYPPTPVEECAGAQSFAQAFEQAGVAAEIRWTVHPAGDVAVEARLKKTEGEGGRLGLSLRLPPGTSDAVRWFGLGPESTTKDSTSGAFLGVWEKDAPLTAEAVRGLRLGALTIRTLGAPLAVEVAPDRIDLFGEPDAAGVVPLAFTLSVKDKSLTARTPSGQWTVSSEQ